MTTKRTSTKASKTRTTKKAAVKTAVKKKDPAKPKASAKAERDPRLPAVGSTLTRQFKGKDIVVEVTEDGFRYKDKTFKSISACARHITGYGISGPVFFKLVEPKPAQAKKES
ncbi:MAG: DUF2924 domain-containing protein [bacterium]